MNARAVRIWVVVVAIVFPSLVTWVYFDLLKDSPLKLIAYSLGKLLQFTLPVLWVGLYFGPASKRADVSGLDTKANWSTRKIVGLGVVFGVAVLGVMQVIMRLLPEEIVTSLTGVVQDRVAGFSLDTPQKFIGLALFYAAVHSFLEEYYFRWFVFGQLRHVMPFVPAMLLSGLAFMAHHVIVLRQFFHGYLGWTALLSVSIAVGGWVWAYFYERGKSLVGPWISHAIVDAGIFAVGYQLLF